jgi:uncharacterized protein (UPF0335 family)
MTDDIVEQLREEGFSTHMARLPRESKILHAAADEIERLRAENATFRRKLADLELNCQHSTALVAHYVRKVERLEGRNAVQE